jgi:hypothetical protein
MSAIALYKLLRRVDPVRSQVSAHGIYGHLQSVEDIRIFMEYHVFAVWDFMSLLKALQAQQTCVKVPWLPVGPPRARRLINEIVLAEETDQINGRPISHFELYQEAMGGLGADTSAIKALIDAVRRGTAIDVAVRECGAPAGARAFMTKTFEFIASAKPHVVAAAFTFGREDPIPNMFRTLIGTLAQQEQTELRSFVVYLDRHIDLDEDHHAPMAVEMLAELCGDDPTRWDEAAEAAVNALTARLALWTSVVNDISAARSGSPRREAA